MSFLQKYIINENKFVEDIQIKGVIKLNEYIDIIEVPGGARIVARENICLSGFDFQGQRLLENDMNIWLPSGIIYYYRDVSKQRELEKAEKKDERFKTATINIIRKKEYDDFWKRGRYGKSLERIAGRLLAFARKRYNYERTIFYLIENLKAKPFLATATKLTVYNTPETVLREVFLTAKPYIFTPSTLGASMSMLENSVNHVFSFPFVDKNSVLAIFYADSPCEIRELSPQVLLHICKEINQCVIELIADREDITMKEVSLE